jgi:hypothetical protein
MIKLLIIVLIIFLPSFAICQEVRIPERIISIAEELAADESDLMAAELFSEWLFELSEDPVLINSGSEEEISRLFFLTDFQVKVLANYVKTSGRIVSQYEIANIPGFNRESAEMIIPFISLDNRLTAFSDSTRFRQTLLTNFILKTANIDTSMLGSPWKILTKYKVTYGSFSAGFTIEKDPGEKFLSGRSGLPDFFSGHLAYKGAGFFRKIVIGDYSARFGQGTNINTGIRTGLSLTSPGYLAGRNEIRPYTSTDENNFFRGAAAEMSFKNFDLSVFCSINNIDATLNEPADSSILSIKSFYKTGLHTTPESLLKKDAAKETGYGLNLSYNLNNLRTGIIFTETRFSLPVIPDLNSPADRFNFSGYRNTLLTFYYNGLIKRFILFGEFSSSGMKKYAFVQGVSFRPADRLSINFMFRNYSPGFVSFHGNGPSGSSLNSNEYGILGNFTFEAARFLFISAGTDLRNYPWLRYRCSAPSLAKKHEIRVKYLPSQKLMFEALFSYRYSMVDDLDENTIPGQEEIVTQTLRGSIKYSPAEYLTLTSRADYKIVNPEGSKGFLFLQDINLRFRRLPLSVWLRYSIFNTGGFESGLYTWENDLLYSFSIPVLYGQGTRAYLMSSWKIGGRAELRFKYGVTSSSTLNMRMKENFDFRIQFRIMI